MRAARGNKFSQSLHDLVAGPLRGPLLLASYSLIFCVSSLLALLTRFDLNIPPEFLQRWAESIIWVIALKLAILAAFGQFRSLLTFFSFPDAKMIFVALGAAAIFQLAAWFVSGGAGMIPRGTIVVDFILSFLGVCGLRIVMRILRDRFFARRAHAAQAKRVAILGAGQAGAVLAREIQSKPGLGLDVVCFFDDDFKKIDRTLHGIPVVSNFEEMLPVMSRLEIAKAIIAMPGASPALISRLVSDLNTAGIDHDILPSVNCILSRKFSVERLRHVAPEDLLGRAPVLLDEDAINSFIHGARVLVTGAGGSIGRELCRQIAARNPEVLILMERAEPALFEVEQEILRDYPSVALEALAGSVCNEQQLETVFSTHLPTIVFHAAAHKHVPLMERQPGEAVWNNTFGTLFCARAAQRHGARRFVLVSTDKAVDPTNAMGASKRLAELVLSELQGRDGSPTVFCSVRFGNVLDSSGSVVPVFRRQIAMGGPVTVTHPEVERYFMSIPEAVGLILQSATFAGPADAFVLDMGFPIRIDQLARQMIELQGFKPDRDISIVYTGLRPGEKLRETPIHPSERIAPSSHSKIRRILQSTVPLVVEPLEAMRWRLHYMPPTEVMGWMASLIADSHGGSQSPDSQAQGFLNSAGKESA
jgi:FlaA1/EpsC-like NDP-sugar epimerase